MLNIYFIDLESTGFDGLLGLDSLDNNDRVIIFYNNTKDQDFFNFIENVKITVIDTQCSSFYIEAMKIMLSITKEMPNIFNYCIISKDTRYLSFFKFGSEIISRENIFTCFPSI